MSMHEIYNRIPYLERHFFKIGKYQIEKLNILGTLN